MQEVVRRVAIELMRSRMVLGQALTEVAMLSTEHNQLLAQKVTLWADNMDQGLRDGLTMLVEDAQREFARQKSMPEKQASTLWDHIQQLMRNTVELQENWAKFR